MEELDSRDKKILTAAQKGLPLTAEPFASLAEKLNLSEQEVISRLKTLKEAGYIRRLGGIFSSQQLGWDSILLAARVPENRFAEVKSTINAHQGVTHNYRRNHDYNMWFTLSVPPEKELEQEIKKLERKAGLEFLRLPRLKKYKLGVKMDLNSRKEEKKQKTEGDVKDD